MITLEPVKDPVTYKLNETTTLKDFQEKSVEILLYFDEFCRKHGLRYYLAGGTCIGAVRHQGFIPWDCDVDVIMLRNDYEKLAKIWSKYADTSRYVFDRTNKTYNMRQQVGTIKDINTTYIRSHNVHYDMNHGVPIDIIVWDNVSDNVFKRKRQIINGVIYSLFNAQRIPNNHGKLAKIVAKIIFGIFRSKNLRYRIWSHCEKVMSKYHDKRTAYVGELICGYKNACRRYRTEWFEEPKEMMFEGHMLYCPTMPEKYLEERYGDYLTFPPEAERIPKFLPEFIDLKRSYKEYKGIKYDDRDENK